MSKVYEYYAPDWEKHIMGPSSGKNAFEIFESKEMETAAIEGALDFLLEAGVLPNKNYDLDLFDKFTKHVRDTFEIPWTGISPRMRRMIFAINSIKKPNSLVCAGVFCGYTYICNAGTSIGPGAAYNSKNHIGIEILSQEAALATKNVNRFANNEGNNIICADAANWLKGELEFSIDLLYIDAKSIDFDPAETQQNNIDIESKYFKIIKNAYDKLSPGALVLAHNSVNATESIRDYLDFVRSEKFESSINLIIDDAGLELTLL